MKYDKISVIMPTYNSERYIKKAIGSVLSQTYKNLELIIIDDCSSDATKEIILDISRHDTRIKFFRLDENSGAAVARNLGIKNATGKYLAFLDSDDEWYQKKLELQIDFMEKNNYNFTCTAYERIDELGDKINKITRPAKKANYNRVLLDCPIGNSTVVYNLEVLGKFEIPNIRKRNDDALWLKILKKEPYIFGLNQVLSKYRIRKNSISSNKFDLIKYHWILYREIEGLSIFRSLFHIFIWILIKIFKIK
jgi:teichuronic acid biosynthesis glycosyltransferase TuaG